VNFEKEPLDTNTTKKQSLNQVGNITATAQIASKNNTSSAYWLPWPMEVETTLRHHRFQFPEFEVTARTTMITPWQIHLHGDTHPCTVNWKLYCNVVSPHGALESISVLPSQTFFHENKEGTRK